MGDRPGSLRTPSHRTRADLRAESRRSRRHGDELRHGLPHASGLRQRVRRREPRPRAGHPGQAAPRSATAGRAAARAAEGAPEHAPRKTTAPASSSRSRPCCSQRCRPPTRNRRPRWETPSSRARHSAEPATPRPAAPSAAARRSPPFRTTPPIPRRPATSAARGWAPRPRHEPVPARAARAADPSCTAVQFSQTNPEPTAELQHRADRSPAHPRSRDHRRPAGHRRKHRRHLQRLRRPDRHHARPFRDGDLPPVPHAGDRHLRQGADRHADPDARLLGRSVPHPRHRRPLPRLHRLPGLRLQLRDQQLHDARLHASTRAVVRSTWTSARRTSPAA